MIGKTNKIENIYICIFVFSIIAGMIYGVVNKDYYKCCESALDIEEGDNAGTIFVSNFLLAGTNLVTAGISSFYLNFHTFSITSSFLYSQGILFALAFLFSYGFFEFFGVMLFGLAGLSLFEKKILRKNSFLKDCHLVAYGTALLLVGAVIEIGLVYLLK